MAATGRPAGRAAGGALTGGPSCAGAAGAVPPCGSAGLPVMLPWVHMVPTATGSGAGCKWTARWLRTNAHDLTNREEWPGMIPSRPAVTELAAAAETAAPSRPKPRKPRAGNQPATLQQPKTRGPGAAPEPGRAQPGPLSLTAGRTPTVRLEGNGHGPLQRRRRSPADPMQPMQPMQPTPMSRCSRWPSQPGRGMDGPAGDGRGGRGLRGNQRGSSGRQMTAEDGRRDDRQARRPGRAAPGGPAAQGSGGGSHAERRPAATPP